MINNYKIVMVKNIPSTDKPTIVPNYKYYARANEIIVKLINGEESYGAKYVMYDHKKREVFRSEGLEFLGDKSLEPYVDESIECDKDFCSLFLEIVESKQNNALFLSHIDAVKRLSTRQPIIIGGCGRSGTTLLLSIMGAHKNIFSLSGESFSFYPKPFRPGSILYKLQDDKYDGKRRWCEKTPKHILSFREIYNSFMGEIKLIHIVRDGRDVITSMHPSNQNSYYVSIDRWVNEVESGLSCRDISLLVKYEDLILDTENTLRNICSYLEEPFDENLLRFSEVTNIRRDYGWTHTVKEIHNESVKKWKDQRFEGRIKEFESNSRAMSLLKELGYT